MVVGSLFHQAKRSYAVTAQAAGHVLTRAGVLDDTAPPLRHTVRHWAYSLTRVHDSLAIAELDVPWWTYGAIDAVELWLTGRSGPLRAYEYGSGASTLWLARRFSEVHSVEHHRGFGELMSMQFVDHPNVSLHIVEPEPSGSPAIGSRKEGHADLDFSAYVGSIDDVDGEFDLIVIDGRAREACLAASRSRLADGGVIVFDNTLRRRYRQAIAASGMVERRYFGLTPTLPYPDQTSVLTAGSGHPA